MKLLAALSLPGGYTVADPQSKYDAGNPGTLISNGLDVVIYTAAFMMFIWLGWGIFQYIIAGGEKEKLARARGRITWAIVGFCIVILAFTISRFVTQLFPPSANPLTP